MSYLSEKICIALLRIKQQGLFSENKAVQICSFKQMVRNHKTILCFSFSFLYFSLYFNKNKLTSERRLHHDAHGN